jgi:hypothetical protein
MHLVEARLKPAGPAEPSVISAFHDLPAVHDEDLVRGNDRGQTVRADEGRPSLSERLKALPNERLGL